AACWKSFAARIPAAPANGDAVLAHGRVSFYEAGGQLQLYVDMIRPAGVGLLHMRFEELKARLELEGLFDLSRKRPLPILPRRIGLVTSPSGAALRDILNVLGRRYPLAEVILAGCQVQGDGAADTIVEALYALYEHNVDVIVVARGGGSIEDLWAFNEEVVARAVFASPVPVISGVGHETDTTIIDFVADLRAPTPSAAAELVAPDIAGLASDIAMLSSQLALAMHRRVEHARADLADQQRRVAQRSPASRLARDRQTVDELLRRAGAQLAHQNALRQARLDGARAQLAALSPLATLERGYAIVRRASDGQVVTSPEQAVIGEELEVTVKDGSFEVKREI
ncbi:MAG TPA: exodeoxyribonuclease VII large subunit, partial [Roseiflexaceae bacterium]|nr:exodeoxyribonuclease VII large subunit [Roseiflexaceae bacterium]